MPRKSREFIIESAAQQVLFESPQEANSLGYIARVMAQFGLPYKDLHTNEYERLNGALKLKILSTNKAGIPFGTIPRLILPILSSEATLKKSRDIELGPNVSWYFREKLKMPLTGGKNGSITRVKNQMYRLIGTLITIEDRTVKKEGQERLAGANIPIFSLYDTYWKPDQRGPSQEEAWSGTLRLSEEFYNGLLVDTVPFDWRALRALQSSPVQMDLYFWFLHRLKYLKKTTRIPWVGDGSLQQQLGLAFAQTDHGLRNCKAHLKESAIQALKFYPQARVGDDNNFLILHPSPPLIPPR